MFPFGRREMKFANHICEANISQRSYFTWRSQISLTARRISLKKESKSFDLLSFFWDVLTKKMPTIFMHFPYFLSPRTPMFNKIKVVFSHHFIQIIGGCKSHLGQCNMIVVIEIILKTMISDSCSIQRQNI